MTTINLKDYYPWYLTNEYIEVSDEVAAELRAGKLAEALTPSVSATTSRTIPSTVMTGSNTLPVCMSRPRRSCWSAWIVSAIFGTLSTPCRRSKVVGWMPTSFLARATVRLLGTRAWTKAPSAIPSCAGSRP